MGVYVDNRLIKVEDTVKFDGAITMTPGKHHTVVEEWDYCGGATYTAINVLVESEVPSAKLSANPTAITSGKSSTLTVNATNATEVIINGSDGSSYTLQPTGGTQSVSPTETTTYTATAIGDGGKATATTTVMYNSHSIPSTAISSGDLDGASNWEWNHDPGTRGTSTGSGHFPEFSPSLDNKAREYSFSYFDHGGEIYHVSFARDTVATHFVYDTYVYLKEPSQIENIEMDMNQVMDDGRTVILGTQCAGSAGTWEYTTVYEGGTHWSKSNIPCNPKSWSADTWHHVQIATHRDANGIATYDWIGLDGVYSDFESATGASVESLNWAAGDLLINFQLDGASSESGSATVYTDKLQVYRW
jgi:hypothetical protein